MTTTGTTLFNLDLNDLVEESFERAGSELRTGYDLRTARRSLNLLTIEWANRGINLWTIEQGQIALTTGVGVYPNARRQWNLTLLYSPQVNAPISPLNSK